MGKRNPLDKEIKFNLKHVIYSVMFLTLIGGTFAAGLYYEKITDLFKDDTTATAPTGEVIEKIEENTTKK